MLNKSDFWGRAYLENVSEDFSIGHWIADSYGDEVKSHGHSDAHIIFITGSDFLLKQTARRKENIL